MDQLDRTPYIGTASWNLPPDFKHLFPSEGTHLQRYAQTLNCVEINSSFYREHRPDSYRKWAEATPPDFQFSVKLSRYFTQEMRLRETGTRLKESLAGISQLGEKWGVLLVQLPPSLNFVLEHASAFLKDLRKNYSGNILWEPRHRSWVEPQALDLLADFKVSKVQADPEPVPMPENQIHRLHEIPYYRWHGSPEVYKSDYDAERLLKLFQKIQHESSTKRAWCIFDNTTYGFAAKNALELKALFHPKQIAEFRGLAAGSSSS